MSLYLRVVCSFIFLFSTNISAKEIAIYIRDDVFIDYQEFVNNRDLLSIKNFSGKTIRRDVVDMILAQQALILGGFNHTFRYIPGKVNFRNTRMLQDGKLLISFDSYWLTDAKRLQDKIYISAPVIRNGEYVAGIYTSPENKKVLNLKTLQDLKSFTAVSTPKWKTDWATLNALPLKELIREDEWLSMARMVNIGWIDFMLIPFHSTEDMSFKMDKIHLIPVPKVAVLLKDSRHFVISKKHPAGYAAYLAIEQGLKRLRNEGTIKQAYTQSGFFVDTTKFKVINQ